MTREEAIKEINKAFEPAFANYIITALTENATISDKYDDCMTREEAINYLKNSMALGEDDDSIHHNEVLEFTIEALEQEHCEDVMAIHTQGLDEEIRCTMCTNPMRSDRGCDGGCMVDKDMYEKVMDIIRNREVKE